MTRRFSVISIEIRFHSKITFPLNKAYMYIVIKAQLVQNVFRVEIFHTLFYPKFADLNKIRIRHKKILHLCVGFAAIDSVMEWMRDTALHYSVIFSYCNVIQCIHIILCTYIHLLLTPFYEATANTDT